jgi:hypothetical protein
MGEASPLVELPAMDLIGTEHQHELRKIPWHLFLCAKFRPSYNTNLERMTE